MAREVDRLLAQLASTRRSASSPAPRPMPQRATARGPHATAPSPGDRLALWARVALGILLGVLITQWPYPHGCGWPLARYLGAVGVVVLAGAWIAVVSWRLRSGIAHVLAYLLLFWGMALVAERVLPRVGYAAEQGQWGCGVGGLKVEG